MKDLATTSQDRQKSGRLITTTPSTAIGTSLLDIKSEIHPDFFNGVSILKVSSKGALVPRIITISDDLFTIFISHDKVTKERLKNRIKYKGYKAYSKFVSTVVGHSAQSHRDIRVIDICDILFVQSGFVGSQKLEAVACKTMIKASQIVSIFHNDTGIDFLMKNENERKRLLNAIDTIRSKYHECKMMLGRERKLLRYIWYDTDWDKSGMIAQSEFLHLLVRINIYIKPELACKLFNEIVNTSRSSPRTKPPEITFNECIDLLRKIKREYFNGNDMRDYIFDLVFGEDKDEVTAEEFLTLFLHGAQNEDGVTINEVKRIFADLNRMEILRAHHEDTEHENDLTIDRLLFEEYLMSSRNDVYDPKRREFDSLSLNEPISHYWINTSHNTYLTGDQLKSYSSVEMYSLALQRGCKCLELDCWDDTTAEIPVVYHGYTLTSKIPFQDIITAIKFYVIGNPGSLPIILSLENHCSPIYQRAMSTILKTTLEDLLYLPVGGCELPTPNELIGKVVIKGKRPPEKEDIDEMITESSRTLGVETIEIDKSSSQSVAVVEDLANLTLLNGVSFKDFETSLVMPSTDMHSFSETKISKVLKSPENVARWRDYNRNHMSRTYPSGSRVDSSNAKPLVAWATGCQLVAMNFQTHDAALGLNDGRFRENGGCGYIRKPDSLLVSTNKQQTLGKEIMLNIRVLSGTCLPKPKCGKVGEIIDPYVVVRVDDVSLDAEGDTVEGSLRKDLLDKCERKTDDVRGNGYCPQWNSGLYSFPVKSPDVAMVSFNVIDSDAGFLDDTMCKASIPVSCLREGLRSVHFYDQYNSQHGPFEFASILVEIEIRDRY